MSYLFNWFKNSACTSCLAFKMALIMFLKPITQTISIVNSNICLYSYLLNVTPTKDKTPLAFWLTVFNTLLAFFFATLPLISIFILLPRFCSKIARASVPLQNYYTILNAIFFLTIYYIYIYYI